MNASHRWAIRGGAALAGLVILVVAVAQLPFFRLRQVEVVGARYVSPTSVIAAAQLEIDQNIFDRLRPHEEQLRAVPGLVGARIERRLPGTLRIEVDERIPVALAAGPDEMIALDWEAQPLPFDPAASAIDLPVVRSADSVLTGALGAVAATDPELFATIESVERRGSGVVMTLDRGRLVVNANPSLEEVRNAGAIWRHLLENGPEFGELDARFEGMVILREETG